MPIKYRSLESTSKILETFFSNTLDDSVTTQQIFETWGRTTEDEKKNKAWLSSTMLHLKKHDLIEPIYERRQVKGSGGSRNTLVGLKLTDRGRTILGRNKENQPIPTTTTSTPSSTVQNLNYDSMMSLVARFQQENPQYMVEFSIRLKGVDKTEG